MVYILKSQSTVGISRNATNNFSIDNKIGEGGLGVVYKGVIDNKVVAIKMSLHLSLENDKEFKKEIILFGGVKHANLLKLLGYCIAKDVTILIFEFMPNGDPDNFLFGPNRSQNVEMCKPIELIRNVEHCYGMLNEMCDVYFGILTLKILTGTKRLSHRGDLEFVDYVEKMLKEGTFLNTMNEEHRPVSNPGNKVQWCLQIVLACASFNQERRPTIKLVLSMLDGAPLELPNPPVLTSSSFSGCSAGLTSESSLTTQYFSTTACRSMELVS
ncbi:hypothetical protein LguiA_026100 [Lonicera macranthoides]